MAPLRVCVTRRSWFVAEAGKTIRRVDQSQRQCVVHSGGVDVG